MENVTLCMIRRDLEGIPEYPLPPGFSLRRYRPGDEAEWVRVQTLAERYVQISLDLFRREFGTDPVPLSERMLFLTDSQGEAIGTATAWFDPSFQGRLFGRVHWVAVVPQFQGRGLARPLLAGVCQRLRDLGHTNAYLITSSARIPALNLYRKFGFVPEVRNDQEREAWVALEGQLRYP